jgi:hypothetical protein
MRTSALKNLIYLPALVLLPLLVVALRIFAYFGVRIEDLQFVFFPLVLLVFVLLPRKASHRIPLSLISLSIVLWLGSAAYVEGLLPGLRHRPTSVISRLSSDVDGMQARALFVRFNEIARTYELPEIEILQRSFADAAEARNWLIAHKRSPFVVRGDIDWLQLNFLTRISAYLLPIAPVAGGNILFDAPSVVDQQRALSRWQLEVGTDVILLQVPGYVRPFALVFQPSQAQTSSEPSELTRHWLAWLAAALHIPPKHVLDLESQHRFLATRIDALNEANLISGPWKSDEPRALSEHLSATLQLLDAALSHSVQASESLAQFRSAAGRVRRTESPELFSAIFNNAAVALLFQSDTVEDFARAVKWLELSSETAGGETVDAAARAAMYNLEALSEHGVR